MSRFKILASTIPLIFAGLLARTDITPAQHPCISAGNVVLQMATAPWQAQSNVSFTDDPARATVKVQIVDSAEAADFAVVDDAAADTSEAETCGVNARIRFIGILAADNAANALIYLSQDGDADYRVYVSSRTFTAREAAALIVSAGRPLTIAASL